MTWRCKYKIVCGKKRHIYELKKKEEEIPPLHQAHTQNCPKPGKFNYLHYEKRLEK